MKLAPNVLVVSSMTAVREVSLVHDSLGDHPWRIFVFSLLSLNSKQCIQGRLQGGYRRPAVLRGLRIAGVQDVNSIAKGVGGDRYIQ